MVGLREIPRTATFAWSTNSSRAFLATGTRAGAVDEGFSNDTQLELWDLKLDNGQQGEELQPTAKIDTDSRFHDIAWAPESDDHPQGVIAGALENGSLDLWDVEKLISGDGGALMSRTANHIGAIKALQFNPFRPELLATSGAKGELFMSDLNNINKPFRIGNAVARGGDFDCLDWNKKVSHILATGSSEGFVTVWDVKTKKESLTLNNYSRKPASAVAWDPEKHTRLVTAVPSDTDPLILVWDLRNANAPERIIRGHDGGVLSLSWCPQDTDLLLSCGKDNRTICWNPNARKPQSEYYGDFPVVTNWTFQTRWSPHNPSFLATASFDGKISIQSIQNTGSDQQSAGNKVQATDDEDFFSKAQSQPQAASFSLEKAPKWLERPCGASFGFGGKILSFRNRKTAVDKQGDKFEVRQGSLRISTFVVDAGVGTSTEVFENALKQNDLNSICTDKITEAKTDAEKADWEVIKTMTAENPRKALVDHLGFSTDEDEGADGVSKLAINGDQTDEAHTNGTPKTKSNRLSAFFENTGESDGFLSDFAATKGAKTNNPFRIYTASESEPDRRITRALFLGQFAKALDICLQENRMSDAFMIAICGGPPCIEKVQKAYFNAKSDGPNYLRLLASVVGKNLWDIVYNANLADWEEVMATLCTYAGADEFPDLCEALGDRMEDQGGENGVTARKDAAFCYLAGSKLEKAVALWITDMQEEEQTDSPDINASSSFSAHAKSLQNLIEKVTIFREVTDFEDKGLLATSEWKLAPLYDLYTEYADILASQGQLQTAERYLDLLPDKYPAAEAAKSRVKQATKKAVPPQSTRKPAPTTRAVPRGQPNVPDIETQQAPNQNRQPAAGSQYAPAYPSQPQNPYAPTSNGPYRAPQQPGYQSNQMQQPLRQQARMVPPPIYGSSIMNPGVGPPPRNLNASPSIPAPSKAATMSNWNDLPEDFIKAPTTSRRGTPGVGAPGPSQYTPASGPTYGGQPKSTPPLPPPPKGFGGPPRTSSPATTVSQSSQPSERPSSAANAYAPQQTTQAPGQSQRPPQVPRGTSPYNALPSAPPPSNRYAPAPTATSSQPDSSSMSASSRQRPPPPNPFVPQQPYQAQQQQTMQAPGQVMQQPPTLPQGPSSPPQGPPQTSRPNTAQSQRGKPAPSAPKNPPGDRSHIPANAQPVYEILNADFQRVKARAPSTFKVHVNDAEKRLNILFDHLNNEDLLKPDTIESMSDLAHAVQSRDYEQAQAIHVDILTNKTDECGNWMVGVKRLIAMSRSTP